MTEPMRPTLSAALVCERVLQEKDGTISVIRIVDGVELAAPPGAKLPAPGAPIPLAVLVAVKSGGTRGRQAFRVTITGADGRSALGPEIGFETSFERDESGHNLILNVMLQVRESGLYWLEVYWEGDHIPLGRTPVRIDLAQPTQPGG